MTHYVFLSGSSVFRFKSTRFDELQNFREIPAMVQSHPVISHSLLKISMLEPLERGEKKKQRP